MTSAIAPHPNSITFLEKWLALCCFLHPNSTLTTSVPPHFLTPSSLKREESWKIALREVLVFNKFVL